MKKLDKLAKLSKEHGLTSRIDIKEGEIAICSYIGLHLVTYTVQQDDESIGDTLGHAISDIQDEYANDEPEDKITIKISYRIDKHNDDRWTSHQDTCPIDFNEIHYYARDAMKLARRAYGQEASSYTDWYDIVTVLFRMPGGMWVDLRIARDDKDPKKWRTSEEYRMSPDKNARFTNTMEHSPTPYLISYFIMNALKIAEKLAERANPAIAQSG